MKNVNARTQRKIEAEKARMINETRSIMLESSNAVVVKVSSQIAPTNFEVWINKRLVCCTLRLSDAIKMVEGE